MPEPGVTPQPEFQRGTGPEALDFGAASAANDFLGPMFLDDDFDEDEDEFLPSGEEEEFIFGPSQRPAEPITAGAPFGPGPDVGRVRSETDESFVNRLAESFLARTDAGPEAKAWAKRRLESGE
jgi:hypothetical protein